MDKKVIEKNSNQSDNYERPDTKYCNGCKQAWLCYGVDTESCLTYRERMKKDLLSD